MSIIVVNAPKVQKVDNNKFYNTFDDAKTKYKYHNVAYIMEKIILNQEMNATDKDCQNKQQEKGF